MNTSTIKENLEEAARVLKEFISEEVQMNNIAKAGELMVNCLKQGNTIISCGNGGSMCDAMHFAEELSGRYRDDRKALAAISISDPSHISCVGNDYGFEHVFSRYIEAIGNKGDVLLAISTSGNSPNVLNAINAAKKKGMLVVGLTGKSGGEMGNQCDIEIRVPNSKYADRAQELHIKIIHNLINLIEDQL